MIDIPLDAKVECTDGYAGQSSHVIINPIQRKHAVPFGVRYDGSPVLQRSMIRARGIRRVHVERVVMRGWRQLRAGRDGSRTNQDEQYSQATC